MEPAPLHAEVAEGPAGGRAFFVRAGDGVRLRLCLWARGPRGTILLFPGRTEVVEKYGRVATRLAAEGWGVLAIDWRGQGLSDRLARDAQLGHVRSFAEYRLDVAALTAAAAALEAAGELAGPRVLLAHSMGGCIGLRALAGGLAVRAAAFSAPMWGLPLTRGMAVAAEAAGRLSRIARSDDRPVPGDRPEFSLAAASFDDNVYTTDADHFAYMQRQVRAHPELALGAPTLGWLAAALAEMRALTRHASPPVPALAAIGSREKIVAPGAVAARMARWPQGACLPLAGAEHELMMEAPAHRERFLAAALALFAGACQPEGRDGP